MKAFKHSYAKSQIYTALIKQMGKKYSLFCFRFRSQTTCSSDIQEQRHRRPLLNHDSLHGGRRRHDDILQPDHAAIPSHADVVDSHDELHRRRPRQRLPQDHRRPGGRGAVAGADRAERHRPDHNYPARYL